MKIAAYCRVSTDHSDQLNSLETQKKFFTEYTEKNGHELVRLYADEGLSGTKIKNRRAFQTLMQEAQQGLFELVLVKDISRFARNTVDLLQSTRTLKALGIETLFLTANMTTLGNSEFVLTVFGALAQEESANTSKRIKFGKQLNAERGRVPNLVFGYDKTAGDYFHLCINPQEAQLIRQMFDWYTQEGYGASKIASMLNERACKTKRGCAWSQNAVCRILQNALYTGKVINGKQEVQDFLTGSRSDKDEHDWHICMRPELQIISEEQFHTAAQLLHKRGQAFQVQKERQSNQHLFSTLIKCKDCGRSFRRIVRRYQNTYVRWVCSSRNGKGAKSCPNAVSLEESELIAAIEAYFSNLLQEKEHVKRDISRAFLQHQAAKQADAIDEKSLRTQIGKLQRSRRNYLDLYTSELISRSELDDLLAQSRSALSELEEKLQHSEGSVLSAAQVYALVERSFSDVADISSLAHMSNAQLRQIIQKIEVSQEGEVSIQLHLFGPLGLAQNVPIRDNGT